MSAARPCAGRRLLVVDLEGSRAIEGAVHWATRRSLRAAGRAGSDVTLLLHGAGEAWRPGGAHVRTVTPSELITDEDWSACQDWITATSQELVFGAGRALFPETLGVHLGAMSLLPVQTYLLDFAFLACSVVRLLAAEPPSSCRIISADPERAGILAALARAHGVPTSEWSPPFGGRLRSAMQLLGTWRAKLAPARRPTAGDLPHEAEQWLGPARTLTISESVPMDQTFASVERRAFDGDGASAIRVHFGGAAVGASTRGGTTVLSLARPGVLPARIRGRYVGRWRRLAPVLRRTSIAAPLAGTTLAAPLWTILEHLHHACFDQIDEHLRLARRILDRVSPELLVVGNDRWWVGQAFVRLARQRGIPSVCVQDGLASEAAFWRWMAADYFVGSGRIVPETLVRHGADPERVMVAGQPRYDALCALRDTSDVRAAREAIGLEPSACYVLFASQPHHTPTYVATAVAALLAVPGARVVLRPHPTEPPAKYDALLSGEPGRRIVSAADADIFTLLLCCDVVVTEFSTVVLEGAVLGKPAVMANFDGLPPRGTYVQRGLARAARTPAALTAIVDELTAAGRRPASDARTEEGLVDLLGPVDGRASERIAEFIRLLLAGGRPAASHACS